MFHLMLHVFLLKLDTQTYLTNRIGHEMGIEKVLNFDYAIWVEWEPWF